ncbi:MAG TPA: histidine kinase dimerization/phospho-acceptor domain-containing protein, partial [Solirubrobacteraceae bacterium]
RADAATSRATSIAIAGGVLLLAMMVLALVFLRRGVVRPVSTVADAAGLIAGGDLAARVPPRGGRGEVQALGSSFNTMAASLQESHGRTTRQTAELEAQRAELVAAVERLGSEKARVERYLRFGRRIAVESEVDVAAETVLTELTELAGCRAGALYVIDNDREDAPLLAAVVGDVEPPRTIEDGSPVTRVLESGYLARGKQPILGPDGSDELHIPLRTGHLNVGAVVLADPEEGRFSAEAVETAADLAVQAAVTLAKALLLRSVRESATLVRAVLDATPDAIAVTDGDGVTVLENPPMRAVRAALVESARAPGGGFRTDFQVDLSDPDAEVRDELELLGTRRLFARYVGPVRGGSGMRVGRLVVLREITAEREADRIKDEFFALVSHELRTPLTAIIGYVELVLDDDEDALDDTHRTHLEIAQRNARRLLRLVGDLLFVAQVETGQLMLEMAEIDLADVAARSLETFLPRARQAGIDLGADVTRVAPLLGDRDRLGQALENLIANAVKFTPEGGHVEVRVRREGDEAVISVADTGPGIPVEEQKHLFERFFRAELAVRGAV